MSRAISIWGVPFRPWTMARTLDYVQSQVAAARAGATKPAYLITANLNYCMLTRRTDDLSGINEEAAAVIADGMPMVWWSRMHPGIEPLPERVAGSALIGRLCQQAAAYGHRVFLLGGKPDVLTATQVKLYERCPGIEIVGAVSPPFRDLSTAEDDALIQQIRDAKPDILLVAFGQPKGERWIAERRDRLGVPVSIQLGASFDFVAGRVKRAPSWVQKLGMEWAFRLAMEPRRLACRYLANIFFLIGALTRDLFRVRTA